MVRRSFYLNKKGISACFMSLFMMLTAVTFSGTGQAANLVTDNSFEGGTAYWTPGDYASSIDGTVARTGSKSLKLVNDSKNHNAWQNSIGGVVGGTEYTYTVWVKGTAVVGTENPGGDKPLAVLRWRNSSNVKIVDEMYLWSDYGTYNWKALTFNAEAPANAAMVDVSFRNWFVTTPYAHGCVSGTTNWDDAVLEPRDLSYRGDLAGTYQAESAVGISGGTIASAEPNYTGTGYFHTASSGAYLEWNNVDGGTDGGSRWLSFRYTYEGAVKNWDVIVNGVSQGLIAPAATGNDSSWATYDRKVTLRPGNNTVRVRVSSVPWYPCIDKLTVYREANGTPTAAMPIITPNGGSFSGSVQVSLASTTSGAAIYYTTNGTTPTTGSTQYTSPFTLNGSATVRAIAVRSGYNNSAVASAAFTESSTPTAATPSITPNGGSFTGSVQVSLASTTSGAAIYYTTNGATPTAGSTLYASPFTLNGSATVKAIAVADGHNNSAVASATFTATSGSQSPYGGITWPVPGTIEGEHYDMGGEGVSYHDVTTGNAGGIYRTDDVDIWLAANSPEGYYAGDCRTGEWLEYTVNVASAGLHNIEFRVCTVNSGRTIHAELDGVNVTGTVNVPNTGSWEVWQNVSKTVTMSAGQHVLRVAFDNGGLNLNKVVISNSGGVLPTAATPLITPNGGSFTGSVQVSLTSTTSGAAIYYTTNGATPTTGSTLYASPFTLNGSATVKAIAVASGHNNSAVASAAFTATSGSQSPYGGVVRPVPGTIETEDYDTGGEGVAYHDLTAANGGGLYRTDGVDIWLHGSEGYYAGDCRTGEWLEYSVDVETAGQYSLDVRTATPLNGRSMHMEMDGVNISGLIVLPNTGSYSVWGTTSATVNLTEGEHVLRVFFDNGGFNFNWIDLFGIGFADTAATPTIAPNGGSFTGLVQVSLATTTSGAAIYYTTNGATPTTSSTQYASPFTLNSSVTVKAIATAAGFNDSAVASASFTAASGAQQPYGGVPPALPGILEAENYDLGGEGLAYHDLTAANGGGLYRTDGVDIWLSATGEGYYAGDCRSGEWLEYTVDVASAGQYTIAFRVCTTNSGRTMHVEWDGANVTGTVNVPNTGSWEVWADVSTTATLSAGRHVLRVAFDLGGLNLNRITVN